MCLCTVFDSVKKGEDSNNVERNKSGMAVLDLYFSKSAAVSSNRMKPTEAPEMDPGDRLWQPVHTASGNRIMGDRTCGTRTGNGSW